MYGKMTSSCIHGIDGKLIEVEIHLGNGLPQVNVVGLPDLSVRESVERVRAAIQNCGLKFPMQRITINLAPADLRKNGSAFDLAIALGILTTSGQLPGSNLQRALIIGELALDGALRPVAGVLPMVEQAKKASIDQVVVPAGNVQEAKMINGINILGVKHLLEFVDGTAGLLRPDAAEASQAPEEGEWSDAGGLEDFADVQGQHQAKRALTIAAAGMHNIMLVGPPGSGKTMLLRRLPGILPPLSADEALEVTKIYSVANLLPAGGGLVRRRPFRSPHHSISTAGLIGGGAFPRPGEVSLAHRGVLYLDELPEFPRQALEALRQPVEDRQVVIGRARSVHTYPTRFLLAASMNPCPCGYLGTTDNQTYCVCTPPQIQRYRSRLSGPLLDRIDMHVQVPRLDYRVFAGEEAPLSSAQMRESILIARRMQAARVRSGDGGSTGELKGRRLRAWCRLEPSADNLLRESFDKLGFSGRSYERILRISRTIADLEQSEDVRQSHLAEALQYRVLDRSG